MDIKESMKVISEAYKTSAKFKEFVDNLMITNEDLFLNEYKIATLGMMAKAYLA